MRKIAIRELNKFFKEKGFKKKRLVWYLKKGDVYLMCEYQGSRIMRGFYLNCGLYFPQLDTEKTLFPPKSYDWHLIRRYNGILKGFVEKPKAFIELDKSEDELMSDLEDMKNNLEKYILPYLLKLADLNYLKEIFPDKFDHDKLWLQKIREKELVEFLKNYKK